MSAVALGDCLDSFGNIVADMPVPPPVLCSSFAHTLRFYIMSHCVKWAPVRRKAPLVSSTASRPCGFTQQTLCKVAYAGPGLSGVGVPRSVPALHAVTCCPRVVLSLCVWSVASQVVFIQRLRRICCVSPPLCPARAFASLQGEPALLPVRFPSPQGGGATPSGGTRRASLACGQCSSPNSHPPALRAVVSRWREMPSLFGVLCQVLSGRHGANFR